MEVALDAIVTREVGEASERYTSSWALPFELARRSAGSNYNTRRWWWAFELLRQSSPPELSRARFVMWAAWVLLFVAILAPCGAQLFSMPARKPEAGPSRLSLVRRALRQNATVVLNGTVVRVPNPVPHLHVLYSGSPGRCHAYEATTAMATTNHCLVAVNGGPFNMSNSAQSCQGPLVADNRTILRSGGMGFGLAKVHAIPCDERRSDGCKTGCVRGVDMEDGDGGQRAERGWLVSAFGLLWHASRRGPCDCLT